MFGRRNPDRAPEPQPAPQKTNFSLDMLDDLPEFGQPEPKASAPASEQPKQAAPAPEQPKPAAEADPAWLSAAPAPLGPSVTQLLRQAGGETDPAKTQQLPSVDMELAQPAAAPMWEAQVGSAQPLPAGTSERQPAELPTLASELGFDPEEFWSEQVPAPAVTLPPLAPVTPSAPAAAAAQASARTSAESVIGPDDFFDGHYRSERGVRIQGNARGSIESRQYILVEEGAQVEADLAAQEIMIAGNFTGKITCQGRLEIAASGVVQGVITTAGLVVHAGGLLDGELHMRRDA